MPAAALIMQGVSKCYPVFTHPWQAVKYLARVIRGGDVSTSVGAHYVAALQDVNLTIARGERVGIIGRNGAGKSTLLKLIAGDFTPTKGRYEVHGSMYCLLPGSVSFVFEQTVEENARHYLNYFHLSASQITQKLKEIEEFTELGAYFTQPVKNLSLGMRVRAEFAVATSYSAEMLIIDEVLGAGDIYWAEKIARRMEQLCAGGTTLLLVSHALDQINRYCQRAIWIERGKVVMDGPTLEVTKGYEGFLERLSWHRQDVDDKSITLENVAANIGDQVLQDSGQTVVRWPGRAQVYISGVWLNGEATNHLTLNDNAPFHCRLMLRAKEQGTYCLRYLLTFWDAYGKRIGVMENDAHTAYFGLSLLHEVNLRRDTLSLITGTYNVTITVTNVDAAFSTTNEHVIREDVLYKSFALTLLRERASGQDGIQPIYRLRFHEEPCLLPTQKD